MAYRNLIIENPAYISTKNNQLIIKTDKERSVPLEDISALLVESRQSTISTAALSLLGQHGCAVFVCDEKHIPSAVLTPFSQHSRALTVAEGQLNMKLPLKKKLWQSITVAKIENQARCLELSGHNEEAEHIRALEKGVNSGDTNNIEAVAAAKYFHYAFGDLFYRDEECGFNSALNYGYAVIRGCMARCLAVYGFLPAFGIHHHSGLNSFNLADDLMEPFRPVVDLLVLSIGEIEEDLTPSVKRRLFNCLNHEIESGGQKHSVAYAIERTVQSFSRSITEETPKLVLPSLLEIKQHSYE